MTLSAQGVALVAWVGASVAQVEALRADLMCLDAGLMVWLKKVASPETIFGLGKVDENGGHASLPP